MTAAAFLARQRIEAQDTASPNVFADSYYDNWRDDALNAISQLAPLDTSASLNIVSGTLEYDLPTGFITFTSQRKNAIGYPIYGIKTPSGGILSLDSGGMDAAGLPYEGSYFSIYGQKLVFPYDPGVTETWTVHYGGTYAITTLPDSWVKLALDYATASYYDARASAAGAYFNYSIGSESVTKAPEAERWLKLKEARIAAYNAGSASIATRVSSMGTFQIFRA